MMKNKKFKKLFYLFCSWLLIFSMCFLNLNTKVSAEDNITDNSTEEIQEETVEEETQENTAEEDVEDHQDDTDVPDRISVQSLETTSNEDTTDKVEYVDMNGNAIDGAPTTIQLGKIDDHKELNISDEKHYEFKSAQVDGKDCVYIGKYEDTVYYSTDGVIAIKLEENQKLTMKYQEYYNITVKEDIPENGTAGTITSNKQTIDTSQTVRVNAGQDWSFTVTPAVANSIRYKISSVTSEKEQAIIKDLGDEYGATYTAQFQKDDVITIAYSSEGVYRVHVEETNNEGTTCINTDKDHYSDGYINDFTFTESDLEGIDKNTITLPVFHVIDSKRIVSLQLNGKTLRDDTSRREVPVSTSSPLTVRITTSKKNTFSVQIKMVDLGIGSTEKECNYGYQLIVKKISGEWEDLNFTPTYGERRTQTLTLKVLSGKTGNLIHSDSGAEVAVYNYDEDKSEGLEIVHDNDIFSMNPTHLLNRKQVKFIFAKAKPGYTISIGGERTSGTQTDNPTYAQSGVISNLNENTLGGKNFTNFNNNWEKAKAAAIAQGYTHFLVMTGEEGNDGAVFGLDWDLYVAQVIAITSGYYVMYDKGDLPTNLTVENMPESSVHADDKSASVDKFGGTAIFGERDLNSEFTIGEGNSEPTCEGYRFVGWKLTKNDNTYADTVYSNGSQFSITSDNMNYADNYFRINYESKYAYRFVAQWEKIGTRNVKVNHYLKVPDGTEVLKKTTEGTISFSQDNEMVTAIARAEPIGTFKGYIFDKDDSRNILEKTVTNDGTTDTIELNLYYKPTVLTVNKVVSGYNLEPKKDFTFTIEAIPNDDTDSLNDEIYIQKNNDAVETLSFTENKPTFTLKKDESVNISCLPTGWTYIVTEKNETNFTPSYVENKGDKIDGNKIQFTMSNDGVEKIEFTNTSKITPPITGINSNHKDWIWIQVFAIGFSILGFLSCMRKKSNRKRS